MHRWTARVLLVLLLLGVLAPAALALAAPAMHACCVRKAMRCHSPHEAQFATPGCCGHDCCKSLVVSHWAENSSVSRSSLSEAALGLVLHRPAVAPQIDLDESHSGRAPPVPLLT